MRHFGQYWHLYSLLVLGFLGLWYGWRSLRSLAIFVRRMRRLVSGKKALTGPLPGTIAVKAAKGKSVDAASIVSRAAKLASMMALCFAAGYGTRAMQKPMAVDAHGNIAHYKYIKVVRRQASDKYVLRPAGGVPGKDDMTFKCCPDRCPQWGDGITLKNLDFEDVGPCQSLSYNNPELGFHVLRDYRGDPIIQKE